MNNWADRLTRLFGNALFLVICSSACFASGYATGFAKGQRMGVAAVMCAMDRIANSKPVGAMGRSEYCQAIYRQKP